MAEDFHGYAIVDYYDDWGLKVCAKCGLHRFYQYPLESKEFFILFVDETGYDVNVSFGESDPGCHPEGWTAVIADRPLRLPPSES